MNELKLTEELTEEYDKFRHGIELLMKSPDFSVGTTPSEVFYTEDKMKLIHYIPAVAKTHPVPVLIVYALVNRYYILDLQPDKSVVKKLLEEGFDVYVIDWGYPSGPDRYLTLDDYVNGYLHNSVEKIKEISGLDKITLLGVCQGGTFSIMYSALHPENVKNLVTLVAPVNFDSNKGILNLWAKGLDVDKIVDYYGIVPGDFLNSAFLLLDPFRLMIDKYIGMFERIECNTDDATCEVRNEDYIKNFLRMEKWIFDSPDQAGETFRQFMKDCYQKNLLIKNEMELNGKKINLKNITMPVLNVMAEFDHLVPNDASIPLADAISSTDKDTLVFPTGHIGIFVGSKSQKEVCPKIATWLKPRSFLNGKGDEKIGSGKKERLELAKEITGSGKEELPELAREKKLEQNIKKRKSRVNKK
ncbi:MAG: class III poly(R)-hydroxyalkanoic acid synthase subunit PhaC [Candidatus Methanoperedens sp.]|nr:class III poly(R)-hydroxyalkanoic acid synthase subunit PhaC [Candidatus Methanoperedens sp.]